MTQGIVLICCRERGGESGEHVVQELGGGEEEGERMEGV